MAFTNVNRHPQQNTRQLGVSYTHILVVQHFNKTTTNAKEKGNTRGQIAHPELTRDIFRNKLQSALIRLPVHNVQH